MSGPLDDAIDDAAEMYREAREQQKARRRHNRERNERELERRERAGEIHVILFDPSNGHRRVWNRDRSKCADLWPSTGTVQDVNGKHLGRGMGALLRAIGVKS